MAQDNKVVSLKETQGYRSTLPAALVRLRDASARSLADVLFDFFDSADDVLFGMADRAESNQDQVAYFDAMRELRLRRKTMTSTVLGWVGRAFNDIGQFDPMPSRRGLEQVDQDSLSIMDDSELEKKVAIDSLVNKLSSRYGEPVRLLSARIAHLTGHRDLADRQMPLSPEVICSGLAEACGDLDIDIRARLVVIKLFDRLLVDRLETLYQEANQLLVAEGVLPDLKRPPVARSKGTSAHRPVPSASGRAPDAQPGHGPASATGEDGRVGGDSSVTFSELSRLLHEREDGSQTRAVDDLAVSTATVMETQALMAQLGGLQRSAMTSENGQVLPLSVLLKRILNQKPDQRLPVKEVDGDVINLVAMLFEFILDDRQLPAIMKMLIGRLQIPVLKVALLDRSFFNRGGHPARKLLNELAMAGIGWVPRSDNQRDPLREKVEYVVDRLLNEFTDNVALFGELLQEFQHFVDLDRRRRELVEQRLRDAEEGRARHELAKEQVRALLAGLQTKHQLPEKAQALVNEPWRKYLEWIYLRQGESSTAWQEAAHLTSRLVWSLDPQPVDDNTREALLKSIPEITDALRSGLHSISWDPFAIDAAIRDLELAHVDVLQGLATRQALPEAVLRDDAADQVSEAVTVELEPGTAVVSEPSAGEPEPVVADLPPPDVAAGQLQQESEPEAAVAPSGQPEMPAASPSPGTIWTERAASLRVGCWVEMTRDGGRLRCKLAAIIRATGKYIFVNRNGAKVAEYLQDELAQALAEERVTLLDDGLIFDRALESIIDNLRHNRRD